MEFNQIQRCKDHSEKWLNEVDISEPKNSDKCNQHPFKARLEWHVCHFPLKNDIKESMFDQVNLFEKRTPGKQSDLGFCKDYEGQDGCCNKESIDLFKWFIKEEWAERESK